jgi:hypothetical protein
LHGKDVNRPLRTPPQHRIWLPALPDAHHPRSDKVAVTEALDCAERHELFGESVSGRFSQPADASKRCQAETLIGVGKSVQNGECAVENCSAARHVRRDQRCQLLWLATNIETK